MATKLVSKLFRPALLTQLVSGVKLLQTIIKLHFTFLMTAVRPPPGVLQIDLPFWIWGIAQELLQRCPPGADQPVSCPQQKRPAL